MHIMCKIQLLVDRDIANIVENEVCVAGKHVKYVFFKKNMKK